MRRLARLAALATGCIATTWLVWPAVAAAEAVPSAPAAAPAEPATAPPAGVNEAGDYMADGREPYAELQRQYATLASDHGWISETIYAYAAPNPAAIRAWRTPHQGAALWIISGVHGEEPAGPNAIAAQLPSLARLATSGVPIVLIPLANPNAYRHNWRYPNTAERDWKTGGGYSVGDSEYLLPDPEHPGRARAPAAAGPETEALTEYVLKLARDYPPRLVLDLHEDELSTEGGYIYSQGHVADANPVGAQIVRLLQAQGIPLRQSGFTRFGEPIVDGVISRDDHGQPIRDGSIDELLAAPTIIVGGRAVPGPNAHTVIVVETPAFAGSRFAQRVAAQGAVVHDVADLWQLVPREP